MKLISYYLVILFVLTSCSDKTSSDNDNIKSWTIVSPDKLNKYIQQAYKENQSWVNSPELYIFNLLDITNLKKYILRVSIRLY